MNSKLSDQPIAFFVGIDWADKKHDECVVDRNGNSRSSILWKLDQGCGDAAGIDLPRYPQQC